MTSPPEIAAADTRPRMHRTRSRGIYEAAAALLRPRLWIGLAVGLTPWIVWAGSLVAGGGYKDAAGKLAGADHLAFYTAAHLIRDGEPGRMYDYAGLGAYQQRLIGWDWSGFEAYRNPPFYALLYVPTAGLSYYASLAAWTAVSLALLVLVVWLLQPEQPLGALIWSLAFYPVFATISFGQNTMLSMAIAAGIYRLLKADRMFAAGLLSGLLWFKPQLLLGFFVWWLFCPRRYFRCWLGVGITGAALAAVSWGLLWDASEAFAAKLREIVGFGGFEMYNVHTPKAFFELLLPGHGDWVWPLTLSVIGASLAVAWRLCRRHQGAVDMMFPTAVFLSLWASPHALIYEWALLVPAAIVLRRSSVVIRDDKTGAASTVSSNDEGEMIKHGTPETGEHMKDPASFSTLPLAEGPRASSVPPSTDVLFALAWVGLTVSTPLTFLQTKTLGLPAVIQVSVPILGAVGWLAARQGMRRPPLGNG